MIDKNRIKGIIFDYGGTLDSGGDHWSEVIWKVYLDAGVRVDKKDFRDAYVYAERMLAKTRWILPGDNFSDLMMKKIHTELEWLETNGFVPEGMCAAKTWEIAVKCYVYARNKVEEAKPVLTKLKRRYPLALVTNFYGNVESVLKDFKLLKYFPEVIESAVVGVRKPDPKIFELGAEALGIAPAEIVVIGDSYRKDIEPAEKIGCQAIWIKGKGWTEEEDARTHPNTISSIEELPHLL